MESTPAASAVPRQWDLRRREKQRRIDAVRHLAEGPVLRTDRIVEALESLVASGDRVVLEGNNQKQADFLARALVQLDPGRVNRLHMIQPAVSLPEHLDLFERGIASKLDFAFAGAQSLRISQFLQEGTLQVGALHTYIELYARLYVDLAPNVVLVAAYKAQHRGHAGAGRSRRLPRWDRDRPGQRDRRRPQGPAARRHSGFLGRLRGPVG